MQIDQHAVTEVQLRHFGFIVGGITAVLFGILPPLIWSFGWPAWPWVVGGVLAALALASPRSLRPVYGAWMRVGLVLGWINTRVLLFLVYATMVVPIGVGMRLLGRDPMERRIDKELDSYRVISRDEDPQRMNVPY
jgi:hypothetical protein